jgi:NAD(P)-dependent dehydrogenase (short-subunit alcohol dehydrogenase family)
LFSNGLFRLTDLITNSVGLISRLLLSTVDIVASTGNNMVEVRYLDLSSLDSVRQFANNIIDTEPRLDVLINNAGVAGSKYKMTADNLQLGMQVNHFGPFLLTCLLLGKTLSANLAL